MLRQPKPKTKAHTRATQAAQPNAKQRRPTSIMSIIVGAYQFRTVAITPRYRYPDFIIFAYLICLKFHLHLILCKIIETSTNLKEKSPHLHKLTIKGEGIFISIMYFCNIKNLSAKQLKRTHSKKYIEPAFY